MNLGSVWLLSSCFLLSLFGPLIQKQNTKSESITGLPSTWRGINCNAARVKILNQTQGGDVFITDMSAQICFNFILCYAYLTEHLILFFTLKTWKWSQRLQTTAVVSKRTNLRIIEQTKIIKVQINCCRSCLMKSKSLTKFRNSRQTKE